MEFGDSLRSGRIVLGRGTDVEDYQDRAGIARDTSSIYGKNSKQKRW